MALRPTGSQFDKFKSGAPYQAVVTGLEPVPGKWKPQFKITMQADVAGDLVEVSDWFNQTINQRLDGQPSDLGGFFNACSGRVGAITYFDSDNPSNHFSYRQDEKPEFSLLGSELILRGEHRPKKNGDGTYFTIVNYSSVPAAKPAKSTKQSADGDQGGEVKDVDPDDIPL